MTEKEKLVENTILALQGKLVEANDDEVNKVIKKLNNYSSYEYIKDNGWTDDDIRYIISRLEEPSIILDAFSRTNIDYYFFVYFKGITLDNLVQILRVCGTKSRDYDHLYKIFKNNDDILQEFINNKISDDELKNIIHYNAFYSRDKKNIPYLKPYKVNTSKSSGMRSGASISKSFENTEAAPLIFEAIHNLEQALSPYKITVNDLQLIYIDRTSMFMAIFLQDDRIKDIITDSGNSRNLIKNTAACSAIYNDNTQKYDIALRYAIEEKNIDIVDEGLTPSKKLINTIVSYFNSIDEELINDYKRRYKKN